MSVMLVSVMFTGIGVAQTTDSNVSVNQTETNQTETNVSQNNTDVPLGLQISAMTGRMSKEFESALDKHTLKYKMKRSESNEERKQIVNEFVEKQVSKSNDAVANKNRGNGQVAKYNEAMDIIETRNSVQNAEFAKKQAKKYNISVNKSKVQILSNNAQNMTGQQVSSLAKSMAGPPNQDNSPPLWSNAKDKQDKKKNGNQNNVPTNSPENETQDNTSVTEETDLEEDEEQNKKETAPEEKPNTSENGPPFKND